MHNIIVTLILTRMLSIRIFVWKFYCFRTLCFCLHKKNFKKKKIMIIIFVPLSQDFSLWSTKFFFRGCQFLVWPSLVFSIYMVYDSFDDTSNMSCWTVSLKDLGTQLYILYWKWNFLKKKSCNNISDASLNK